MSVSTVSVAILSPLWGHKWKPTEFCALSYLGFPGISFCFYLLWSLLLDSPNCLAILAVHSEFTREALWLGTHGWACQWGRDLMGQRPSVGGSGSGRGPEGLNVLYIVYHQIFRWAPLLTRVFLGTWCPTSWGSPGLWGLNCLFLISVFLRRHLDFVFLHFAKWISTHLSLRIRWPIVCRNLFSIPSAHVGLYLS